MTFGEFISKININRNGKMRKPKCAIAILNVSVRGKENVLLLSEVERVNNWLKPSFDKNLYNLVFKKEDSNDYYEFDQDAFLLFIKTRLGDKTKIVNTFAETWSILEKYSEEDAFLFITYQFVKIVGIPTVASSFEEFRSGVQDDRYDCITDKLDKQNKSLNSVSTSLSRQSTVLHAVKSSIDEQSQNIHTAIDSLSAQRGKDHEEISDMFLNIEDDMYDFKKSSAKQIALLEELLNTQPKNSSQSVDYPLFVAAPAPFSPITTKSNRHKSLYKCGYDDSTLVLTGRHNDGAFAVISNESIFINWKSTPVIDIPNSVLDMIYALLCNLGGDFTKKKIGICSGHDEYITIGRFNDILKSRLKDKSVRVESCSLDLARICDVLIIGCPQTMDDDEMDEISAYISDGGSVLFCGNAYFWVQSKDANGNSKKTEDFPINRIGRILGFKIEPELIGKQSEINQHLPEKQYLQFTPLQLLEYDITNSEDERLTMVIHEALAGNSDRQNELGVLYESGKSFDYALYWYKMSAFAGNDKGQYNLALCYTEQFNKGASINDTLCVAWLEHAVRTGRNMLAIGYLGYARYYGKLGLPMNKQKGTGALKVAASEGWSKCQYELGIIYLDSEIYSEAVKWFMEACFGRGPKHVKSEAQYQLALLLRDGKGCTRDFDKALLYLKLAANNGHSQAEKAHSLLENELKKVSLSQMLNDAEDIPIFTVDVFEGTPYSGLSDKVKEQILTWLTSELETQIGEKVSNYLSDEQLSVWDKIADGDNKIINSEIKRLRIKDSIQYGQLVERYPYMDAFALQKEVLEMRWLSYNLPEYSMLIKTEVSRLKHMLVLGKISVPKI